MDFLLSTEMNNWNPRLEEAHLLRKVKEVHTYIFLFEICLVDNETPG